MTPIQISAYTLVTAAGRGRDAMATALREGGTALRPSGFCELDLPVGWIAGLDESPLAADWARFDCRNNRLAELALRTDGFDAAMASARRRHGAARIGVFVGTSTSGIHETELAFRRFTSANDVLPADFPYAETHRISAPADFLAQRLGLEGPVMSISTACSSSAKAFAAAVRHMRLGLCDAALVAGVDSLCLTTLYGFHALQLTTSGPCRPFAADRDGLCVGEGAGLALLEPVSDPAAPTLLGYGESADAHHMSTPHPEAEGARLAIRRALTSAGLTVEAIDYVNFHGTATSINDATEDRAVSAELGIRVPCSSTKGWTGHTLGAAGIVEALIGLLAMADGHLPATQNTTTVDPEIRCNVLTEGRERRARRVLTNSFGFGGNNCTLILGAGNV